MLSKKYLAKASLIRLKRKIIRNEKSKHVFSSETVSDGGLDIFCLKCQCGKKWLDESGKSCAEMKVDKKDDDFSVFTPWG